MLLRKRGLLELTSHKTTRSGSGCFDRGRDNTEPVEQFAIKFTGRFQLLQRRGRLACLPIPVSTPYDGQI